jgi:hypothetical protein
MTYEYVLTLADFKAAQRLFMRQTLWRRINGFLWIVILPIVGALSLGLLLYDVIFRHFKYPASIGGILAGLAWFGLYLAIMRPITIRRIFKQLSPGGGLEHSVSHELTENEFISRIAGRSEGRFLPAAFYGFAEDEQIAILLVSKKKFLFVPKRAMPEEAWAELRAWLDKNGKR